MLQNFRETGPSVIVNVLMLCANLSGHSTVVRDELLKNGLTNILVILCEAILSQEFPVAEELNYPRTTHVSKNVNGILTRANVENSNLSRI